MADVRIPTFTSFMNPVLQALKTLGGSGTIEEIDTRASKIAGLSDEQLEVLHSPERGGRTEVESEISITRLNLDIVRFERL